VSIGETLADARRQSGLTIAQVSQRTRIRESIIRAIEQDDFSPCGGDFYARGHIRSIAGVVGCDPVPLVREYDNEHPAAEISAAKVFEPTAPIKIREPGRRRLPVGIVVAVVLLAVIGYFSYRLAGGSDTARSTATPAATVTPAVAPKTPPAPSPTPSPARKKEAVIVLTASRDCWVNLTVPGGKQIYQGVVAAGKTRTWKEKHTVSLVIGNPSGVNLQVNGKRVKPNTVQVVTLRIDPSAANPVSVAAPAGTRLAATR
jgi:cytoskeletal protein RodZ